MITYTATWKDDKNNNGTPDDEEEFTVIFKDEDGTELKKVEKLALGDKVEEFKPTKENFVIIVWTPEFRNTVKAEDSDKNGVITYTATWKDDKNNNGTPDDEEEFTVIFKDEDGTELKKAEKLSLGDKVEELKPTKTDYVFVEWTPEFHDTVKAEDADKNGVITYTASWKDDKNNNGIPDDEEEDVPISYKDADKDDDKEGNPDEVTETVPVGTKIIVDPNGSNLERKCREADHYSGNRRTYSYRSYKRWLHICRLEEDGG